MPQYAVLIWESVPAAELAAGGHRRARRASRPRMAEGGGKILAGIALHPKTTATSIRGDLLTDGPFIETKEDLAGVYVLEARDLDHALALAKLTPIVEGGVEVRPLLGFEVVD